MIIKKSVLLAFFGLWSVSAFCQKQEWKEMQEFHNVMSATFHPAEENNFKPIRDSAAVLVTRAKAWQKSAAPQGFNASVVTPILKRLAAECAAVEAGVKRNYAEKELMTMLTKAHETFHEIQEKCRKPGE